MAEILLVDDDAELAELTADYLTAHGHVVSRDDGFRTLGVVRTLTPDLLILDVELPGQTGFNICRTLRDEGVDTPIMFVTTRQSEVDEILSFELGADDYVRKPVDPRVLLLRVAAALRKRTATTRWSDDELAIDPSSRRVLAHGDVVKLTTSQFDLLWLLAQNAGEAVTRDTYFREIRGIDYDGLDRSFDARIRELRARLADADVHDRIVTVRGVGYQMTRSSRAH